MDFIQIAKQAKEASLKISGLFTEVKNDALLKIADNIEHNKDKIFEANKKDLDDAKPLVENGEITKSTYNRLKLDENKLRILAVIIIILVIVGVTTPLVLVNRKLEAVKKEYKTMERDLNKLKSDQSEVDKLLKEQANLDKFANVSEELKDYKLLNTKLIISILSLIPKEIFLTNAEFHLDSNNPYVDLHGHADNSDSVFQLLSTMSQNNLFQKPVLKSTNEVEIDEQRYFIRFVLSTGINIEELYPMDNKENEESEEGEDEDDGGEEEE